MRSIYLISKTPYPGVIHLPVLTVQFLKPPIDFSLYDGIIVTSKQGVSALEAYECDWNRLEVICVGESTAKELKRIGIIHPKIAQGYGENIAHMVSGSDKRWLYLRPESIASAWPDKLRQEGIDLDEVVIYRTHCNDAMQRVNVEEDGVLIFTSPSSIECYLKHYTILPTHTVITIGKTTQKHLPDGVKSYLSSETSIESCVALATQIAFDSSPF